MTTLTDAQWELIVRSLQPPPVSSWRAALRRRVRAMIRGRG